VEFLELFPEGEYEFEGKLRDGGEICGTAEFSHNLPGAPDTEAELDGDGNLVISWEEAEGAHPCLTPAATDAYRPHRSL
jgi:hypothetical protein